MANVRLSKSALLHEREQLKLYEKLLPSLDMKRRQLTLELEKARRAAVETQRALTQLNETIGTELPMLANAQIDLTALVKVSTIRLTSENLLGARVPKLGGLEFAVASYSPLIRPAWVDNTVERLKEAAEMRLQLDVVDERVRLLERALRRITQRVNLFERILVPTAKHNIKKIQVFLGEIERDAVIRSKLAKARH